MLENYYFDEENKRFKPLDKVCNYCGKGTNENDNENFYFKIFKEKNRLDFIVYRNVKYTALNLGIPRCSSCKKLHDKVERLSILILITFHLLMIVYIGFSLYFISKLPTSIRIFSCIVYFLYFLFSLFTSFSFKSSNTVKLIQLLLILKYRILTSHEGAEKNKFIKKLLDNGWTINEPNP